MQKEQFDNYWDGTNSEVLDPTTQLIVGGLIQSALYNNPAANTQSVFANMFEYKVIVPLDGVIENREENPDKYFVYPGPNGELPGAVNINVREPKTGKHIGYIDADGVFHKSEKFTPQVKKQAQLLLAKANGKHAVWAASILTSDSKLFVLELNAYLFT